MAKAKDPKQPPPAPKTRPAIDWEAVESDYRAGLLSLREMASAHGVSHVAIKKRADRENWTRDLSAKIKAKAEDLVNRRAVTTEVNAETRVAERVIIEANAERIAQVRGEHRSDIQRARTTALKLLAELEHQTENPEFFEKLVDLLGDDDGDEDAAKKRRSQRLEALQRAISLGSRSTTMKALADALRITVAMEREAYGLDTDDKPPTKPGDAQRGVFEMSDDELMADIMARRGAAQEATAA